MDRAAPHTDGRDDPTVLLRPGVEPLDAFGGKGKSLAALISAGHPVPATGIVTTAAYRRMASEPSLAAFIGELIDGRHAEREEVDEQFARTTICLELASAVADLARTVGGGGPVAVRSSATVEDLHGSSFAGQYRSLLNINSGDPEETLRAVCQVWASLWHPAPTAYRRAFGIDESGVAMAVVVMRMIPATTAGVVFTADPGGSPNSARIEAVEGLGESLVSGERTPEAWTVPRTGPNDLPTVPARALELAMAVEDMTGVPQDIEWAALDEDVVIVQARPITVLDTDDGDGFDTPIDDHELTTAGIVEMVPGVLSPLAWDFNRFLLEEAFRSVLDSLGIIRGEAAEDRLFVRRVRGRAAIDFDQLRAAASAVPGAVAELEEQYFGNSDVPRVDDHPSPSPSIRSRLDGFVRDLRTLRTRRTVIDGADILSGAVRELRDARPDLYVLDDAELHGYSRRLLDLAARGLAAELGVAASGAAAYRRLEILLAGHLGSKRAASAVQAVTVASTTAEPRSSKASAALFAGETWDELGLQPPQLPPVDPDVQHERLDALTSELQALPGWRRRRILTGQFVDLRVHVIKRTVAEVTSQLHRREEAKAAFLELGGELRRVYLELGERLVDAGRLPSPHDVVLLTASEVVAAHDGSSSFSVDTLGRRRNWLSRYAAEGELPIRFTGVPVRERVPLPDGDVLSGWAASPGRCRGNARVVRSSTGRLEPGEILVAEATDASWSPLFVKASGLIVERGGPLSHAAILARELGLPAVLNVVGATDLLDGSVVSVDGDQGVVVIESARAGP